MQDSIEYQIFIGCNDSQSLKEIVSGDELKGIMAGYFENFSISFSMQSASGGYLYKDGSFVTENVLCISVIGADEKSIVLIAKSLAMFMNQESVMIIRIPLKIKYC